MFLKDLVERTLATAAVAGLGYLAAHATSIDPAYAVAIATALTVLKGAIAKKIGNADSASLNPEI